MNKKFAILCSAILLGVTLVSPLSANAASAPKLVSAPKLPVVAGAGTTIQAQLAKWAIAPKNFSLQWTLSGKDVKGATSKSFKVSASQLGKSLQIVQTATFRNGAKTVVKSPTLKLGQIYVSGKPIIGFTDSTRAVANVTLPTVIPANASVGYQWTMPPFEKDDALDATYQVATGDQGSSIGVDVTFRAPGFSSRTISSAPVAIPVAPRVYSQIWSDEFDGDAGGSFNKNIWTPQNGDGKGAPYYNPGWGNQEKQWYLDSLATTDGQGNLTIDAKREGAANYPCYYSRETPKKCDWISAKIVTKNLVGFKYGRIEIRMKGSVGAGTWPAFWLLGANIDTRPWPGCGEIDITELLGRDPNKVYGTLHGPLSGGGGRGGNAAMPNGYADDFHTYAIDWLPDQIKWYVDGVEYHTENKIDSDWVFDHEFYMIVNLAMGGIWPGDVDPAVQAAQIKVDWIRVSTINGVGEVITHPQP